MNIRHLMNTVAVFAPPGDPSGGVESTPASTPVDMDGFSAEELAQIEQMQNMTPTPPPKEGEEGKEGEEPPAADAKGAKEPKEGEDDLELEEGEEELTIDAAGKARAKNGQFVSKSALLRVKEQSKSHRDEVTRLQTQLAAGNARLEQLMQIIQSAPEPDKKTEANPLEEADVNAETDPIGAVQQANRRLAHMAKLMKDSQKQQGERDAQMTEQQREVAIVNAYKADAQRFHQQEPAFKDAWSYVYNLRHAQLEAVGVTEKAARDQIIAQEERGIVHESMKNKRSPAEAIYKLAVASGFKKPAANGNGQQQQQSPAAKRLAEVQRGQEASKSLSVGGGGAPAEGVTFESVAEMSDEQFNAFAETVSGQKKLREWGFM
jgi:hypothetical protein